MDSRHFPLRISDPLHFLPGLILIVISMVLGCLKGYRYSKLVSSHSIKGWAGIISVSLARFILSFVVLLVGFQLLYISYQAVF